MARMQVYGTCRICRKETKLTFEHVPPKSTFNGNSTRIVKGEEALKSLISTKYKPWETKHLKWTPQQRGKGGYYLCGECNSYCGTHYIPQYQRFVHGMANMFSNSEISTAQYIEVEIASFYPLAVFKQIITMFCDINDNLSADPQIRSFLLDKDNTCFDSNKYQVYAFVVSGELERTNGFSYMHINGVGIVVVSEISTWPIGFSLFKEKPSNYTAEGIEITDFSKFGYDEKATAKFEIPKLEINTIISTDFRTKDQIMKEATDSQIEE